VLDKYQPALSVRLSTEITMAKRQDVPKFLAQLQKQHRKFFAAVEGLGKAVRKEGPIDEKTAHLIQLAAAATLRSEGAVHSHAKRALEAGATPQELRHAIILITSTIGFPNVVAALSWLNDVISRKK
jgi:4-carboxymuconolactone decarboxylase